MSLWDEPDCKPWHRLLELYPVRLAAGGSERLVELDTWYRQDLPSLLASRSPAYMQHDELVQVVTWKMLRGTWRARNRELVRSNDPAQVEFASVQAFAALPDLRKAVAPLAELKGVGPATASAVLAACSPESAPFFDEAMALQIPGLGPPAYTLGYYLRYAARIAERAEALNHACDHQHWTPHMIDLALWSASANAKESEEGENPV